MSNSTDYTRNLPQIVNLEKGSIHWFEGHPLCEFLGWVNSCTIQIQSFMPFPDHAMMIFCNMDGVVFNGPIPSEKQKQEVYDRMGGNGSYRREREGFLKNRNIFLRRFDLDSIKVAKKKGLANTPLTNDIITSLNPTGYLGNVYHWTGLEGSQLTLFYHEGEKMWHCGMSTFYGKITTEEELLYWLDLPGMGFKY